MHQSARPLFVSIVEGAMGLNCIRKVTKQLSSSNDFSYLKGRHEGRSSENKTETHEERQLV